MMDCLARDMVISLSSKGWRITSSTLRANSGSSSRKSTPLWASDISPGVDSATAYEGYIGGAVVWVHGISLDDKGGACWEGAGYGVYHSGFECSSLVNGGRMLWSRFLPSLFCHFLGGLS